MDTTTGKIFYLSEEDEKALTKRKPDPAFNWMKSPEGNPAIPVKTGLTPIQIKRGRVLSSEPCPCGSHKPFGICHKTKAQAKTKNKRKSARKSRRANR